MDIKQNPASQNINSGSKDIFSQTTIRTMRGDLGAPSAAQKPAAPPIGLPVEKKIERPKTPPLPSIPLAPPSFAKALAGEPAFVKTPTDKPASFKTLVDEPAFKPTPAVAPILSAGPKIPAPPTPLIVPPPAILKPEKSGKKRLLAALVLIVVALSVFFYWVYSGKPAAPPVSSPAPSVSPTSPTPSPLIPPAALFKIDKQKIIKVTGKEDEIVNALKELSLADEAPATFAHFLFQNTVQNKFLTLDDFLAELKTNSSELKAIENYLAENYTFFAYSQKTGSAASTPFSQTSNQAQNRAGLMLALKTDSGASSPAQILRQTETALPQIFKVLFLGRQPGPAASANFLDNNYKNIPVRYLNFPDASLSFDYAVVGNNLIFATSRESMYAVIDRLLAK